MQIYCVYNQTVYKCDDDGYTVIRAKYNNEYIVCSGDGCPFPDTITVGTPLSLEGDFQSKSKYNFQQFGEKTFVYTDVSVVMPTDDYAAVEYLKNMDIDGISENVSVRFVETFGANIQAVLESRSDDDIIEVFNRHMRLIKIRFDNEEAARKKAYEGIDAMQNNGTVKAYKKAPPKKAVLRLASVKLLRKMIEANNAEAELYKIFCNEGVTYPCVHRIYKRAFDIKGFPPTVKEVAELMREPRIRSDGANTPGCYRLCREAGIDFPMADRIGKRCRFLPYTPERLVELCVWLIGSIADNGHTWSSLQDIYKAALYKQRKTAFPDVTISQYALYSAMRSVPQLFKIEGEEGNERIYSQFLYHDEMEVSFHSTRIADSKMPKPYSPSVIGEIEAKRNIVFSDKQKECFEFLKASGLKIITGGAGTGKTTVISGLIEAFTELNPGSSIALCAPTGRAAQRMTELCKEYGTSVKASTIHKLLEITPRNGADASPYCPANPLPYDMIIVDEMSMVGIHLCSLLLQTIKQGALVVMCGDYDQLPSVDAGKVFRDMIESNRFDVVRLSVNYRQSAGTTGQGSIIENAGKINAGDTSLLPSSDFELIVCKDCNDMQKKIVELITDDSNQTVLTTVKDGPAGTKQLNRVLQPIINKCGGASIEYGLNTYGVGDSILMTCNDYAAGYVNGDIGKILAIGMTGVIVAAFGNERRELSHKAMKDISLAYAMTIHKSQGSEYDNVIIVLPESAQHMLVRNLLYTAVTRAKKKVRIIAQAGGVERAITKNVSGKRRTSLKELLMGGNI